MQAKQTDRHTSHAHPQRLTRAERRAAERAAEKARRAQPQRSFIGPSAVAGALIVAAALVIFGYAVLTGVQNQSRASTIQPMVHSSALDPVGSLLNVGTQAPDFRLRDATGRSHTLSVQIGSPVLVEFFATWCPVCHRETSIIHKLAAAFAPKGVRVWAVLANPYGKEYEISKGRDTRLADTGDLNWYMKTYKANYPLLIDPYFKTVNAYGAGSYPTLYVINRSGKITFARSGYTPYKVLAAKVGTVAAATR